jgi:disulfide bond formation protein DsbB
VLGQMPCTLCWYQRIAMFPLVPLLGIATLRGDTGVRIYALPLALAGLALALWHSGLYAGLIPAAIVPCTASGPSCTDQAQVVLGMPLPYLSTIAFAAILANLSLLKGTRA